MKRYQVYLNQQSVATIDEIANLKGISRSKIIREAVDAAADRISNLLANLKPTPPTKYSAFNQLIDSIRLKDRERIKLSENIDDIYYK